MSQYIVGDSPLLKRVLIPFWVLRILVMLFEIAIYAMAIYVFAHDDVDDIVANEGFEGTGRTKTAVIAIASVIMALIAACLVLDIVCIVKRSRRTLSPKVFLVVNVVQTLFWTVLFAMSIAGVQRGLSLILGVIVYLSFLGLLIYAGVVFHQDRKGTLRGAYSATANPGYNPGANESSAPIYPVYAVYGEPGKQDQFEMDSQPQHSNASHSQGYPAPTHAPQQQGYAQYGNAS